VNAGIGGNRLLRYGLGPSALARLDRDVLGLEAADRQIIARAHEYGVRIIGATLTPFQGAFYSSPAGETVRAALNHWILSSGAFDTR
jgi:hypothetical protein